MVQGLQWTDPLGQSLRGQRNVTGTEGSAWYGAKFSLSLEKSLRMKPLAPQTGGQGRPWVREDQSGPGGILAPWLPQPGDLGDH